MTTNTSSLITRVIHDLNYRRQRLLDGHINCIPSPFIRFSNDFVGIEQQKMYLITASTKGGKTQLSSFLFIYHPLLYAYKHPDKIRIKIFYYPYEETKEDILIRFICYILYVQSGFKIHLSPSQIKSTRQEDLLDERIIELLGKEEYANILNFFEESVIFSESHNPSGVYFEAKRYAEEHGTVHTKKVKVKDSVTGVTKEVDVFDYYEQDDPEEYRIIFADHISLLQPENGMTLKQSIDKFGEYCVMLRNRYKYSPVIIQQQAFAGEGLDAFKENKVRPTIANLGDSKYLSRDANVVLGIFSPFKFELPQYAGYDITRLRDNIRILEVLVNRHGSPGGTVGLYFDGAVNYFSELPNPSDKVALNKVYETVESNRRLHSNVVVSFFISTFNKFKTIISR